MGYGVNGTFFFSFEPGVRFLVSCPMGSEVFSELFAAEGNDEGLDEDVVDEDAVDEDVV